MNRTFFSVFRWGLFFLGLGIISLIYFLFTASREMRPEQTYMWISFFVEYAVFFLPITLYGITLKDFDKNMPAIIMITRGTAAYSLISFAVSLAAGFGYVSIRIAVVIECVLLFFLAVTVFVSLLSAAYIHTVVEKGDQLLNSVKELRSESSMLALKADSLSSAYDTEKKRIKTIVESLAYISPVHNDTAAQLEQNMLKSIAALNDACDTVHEGSDGAELRKQLAALELLLKQRLLQRN